MFIGYQCKTILHYASSISFKYFSNYKNLFCLFCLLSKKIPWNVFLYHESISCYYCFFFFAILAICSYFMCFTIEDD